MKKTMAMLTVMILAMTLGGMALAETVEPNQARVDINRLENQYVLTDIQDAGNGQWELTLFETETFPAEKMEALKAGDVIVTGGEQYTVETVMTTEDGDIVVNEDTNQELVFWKTNYGEYIQTGDDDVHPQMELGKLTVKANEFIYVIDSSDPEVELPTVYTGKEMMEKMKAFADDFALKNVYVVYDSTNEPHLIYRVYTPWQ